MGKKKTPKNPTKKPASKKIPTYTVTRLVPYTMHDGKRKYLKAQACWPVNTMVGRTYISTTMMTETVYRGRWFCDREEAEQFVAFFGWDGIEVFKEIFEDQVVSNFTTS